MDKTLYRSLTNKVIGGVCGGIGEYFNMDPVIVRILFVIGLFTLPPAIFIVYIVMWMAVPLPKNGTPVPEIADKEKPNPASKTLTIFIAAGLIILGILFLIPDLFSNFGKIGALLIALFLFFVTARMVMDMMSDKNLTIVRVAVAITALTYGIFICLNQFGFINTGVYFEYAKNLVAAVIITAGIHLLFRNTGQKLPGVIAAVIVFGFIGVYSFVNGNYQPFGKMMESFHMPRLNQGNRWNFRNVNVNGFSSSLTLPEGLEKLTYNINSSAGSLTINDTDLLLEYHGDGLSPSFTTNFTKSEYTVNFQNQASDTHMSLNRTKTSDITLNVSAGNVEADLKRIPINELKLQINGGSGNIEIGENTHKVTMENNLGSTKLKLPRNAKITLSVDSTMPSLSIPEEFKNVNGQYIYNGGTNKILINARVTLGNLEFDF